MRRALLFLAAVTGLGVWELLSREVRLIRLLASSPLRLMEFFTDERGRLLADTLHTLGVAVAAILVSLGFVAFSLVMTSTFPRTEGRLVSIASALQTIPVVALVPFSVIILGLGLAQKVAIAAAVALFPLLIGATTTVSRIRRQHWQLARFYDLSEWTALFKLYLPLAMPFLLGTLRVAFNFAILGAVIAEFTGSARGIGRNIFVASVSLEPELMVWSVMLCALLSLLSHLVTRAAEASFCSWAAPTQRV